MLIIIIILTIINLSLINLRTRSAPHLWISRRSLMNFTQRISPGQAEIRGWD